MYTNFCVDICFLPGYLFFHFLDGIHWKKKKFLILWSTICLFLLFVILVS